MTSLEGLAAILAILLVAGLLIGLPILLVTTYLRASRVGELLTRLQRLERTVAELEAALPGQRPKEAPAAAAPAAVAPAAVAAATAERVSEPRAPVGAPAEPVISAEPLVAAELAEAAAEVSGWESLIGGRALGWLAVVVLLFATGFFLRYAFENAWIGPMGRVSLGVLAGAVLAVAGRQYDRRGWRVFSQMVSAAGIVLLYLSTYGAFGFYHLIGQREAGVALALLAIESGLLALRYEAPAIALMAVFGGLLTPLLLHSDRDQYVSLFSYLTALDAGVVWLLVRRNWPLIGMLGLCGAQLLFWLWHAENYHPEKRAWAIGFQTAIYLLFLAQTLWAWRAGRRSNWEELLRMPLNAAFWYAAAFVLFEPDYGHWLGTLAVGMAAIYAASARWLLAIRPHDAPATLAGLAIATGFLALAISREADAPWVALGWAAEAAGLWWFGVRVRSAPLRWMAAALACCSVARILLIDEPWTVHDTAWPALNRHAMPALAAVVCLAAALAASRTWLARLQRGEIALTLVAAIGCLLTIWLLVSADIYRYFDVLADLRAGQRDWRRLGQTWISVWWAAYATLVLTGGFYERQAWLRWTALGLYAVAAAKVFLVDMAELDELYRIAAFFVLALVLGAAAWAYQRFQPNRASDPAA